MADLPYQWSDSEPGVDMVGIYVENHYNKNRECLIWIRFDNMKLGEKGCLPLLREDPLISETCPMEESASHHLKSDMVVSSRCVGQDKLHPKCMDENAALHVARYNHDTRQLS